jgi:hypothetical protein
VCGCTIILGQLGWRNFVFGPLHQHVYPISFNNILFTFRLANQVRLLCVWFLLWHSPLTVSSCHSLYSKSDMQIGRKSSWPFTCSWTVSSVFWRHHFTSRSGNQRDHCCLVAPYSADWVYWQDKETVCLHSGTTPWCFLTHGTIIQPVDG